MDDAPDSERQRRRRESGEAHAAAAMEAAAEMIAMWDKDNSGQGAGAPSRAVPDAQPAAEADEDAGDGGDGSPAAEAGVQATSADRQEPDDVFGDTATNDGEDDGEGDDEGDDEGGDEHEPENGDARADGSFAKSEEDSKAGSDCEGSGLEEGSSGEGEGEGAEEGSASEDEPPPAPTTPEPQPQPQPHLEDREKAADDQLTSSTAAPPSPSPSPHSRASAAIKLVTGAGTSQLLAADPALQFPPSPAQRRAGGRAGGRGGGLGREDGDDDGSSGQGVLGHTPSPSPPPSPITSPLHRPPVAMTSGKPPHARHSSASDGKAGEQIVAAGGTAAGEAEAKAKGKDEAIRVIVRVRPANARELRGEEEVVRVAGCEVSLPFKRRLMTSRYDCVLGPAASQGDVYEQLRAPIAGVLRGMNCTIFAYGQTGTGKTHTMLGRAVEGRLAEEAGLLQATPEEEWGVIPRAVAQVFGVVGGGEEVASTGVVTCSYIQIYNHKLYDLLHDVSGQRALAIREAPGDGDSVYVAGLSEVRVGSVEDVMALLHIGNKHRRVRATECNEHSSRSHAVLQLSVATESRKPGARRTVIRRAKLNLVDLAGSEKWNTSSSEAMQADRAKELAAINKSLSALGNCIAALTDGTRQHIPYRDSPLTRLLQDSLGGNTRTVVVATISPSSGSAEESVSTLKFADRARQVMARVRVNEVVDDAILLARARREVARLRAVMKLQAAGCSCGLCECGFAQAGAAGRRLAMGSRALSRSGSSMRLLRTPGSSRSGSRGSRGTKSRAGAVVGGVRSLQRMQQQSRGKAGNARGGSSSKRPPRSSTSSAGTAAGGATSPVAGSGGSRQARRRVGRSPVRLQGGDERQTHSRQRAQRYLEQQRDVNGEAEGDEVGAGGGDEEADRGEDAGNPPLAPRRSEMKAKGDTKPAASAKKSEHRKEGAGGMVVTAKQLKGLRQQISNLTEHSMELVQLLEAEEGKVASLQADKVHLQQQLSQVEAKVKAKASEEVQQASEQREEMARELKLRERRVEELEEEVRQWQAKVAQQAVSVRSRHAPSPSPTTSSPPPPAAAPAPAVPAHHSPAARTPVKTYASSSDRRGSPVKSYSPPSVTQLPQLQPQPSQASSPQPAQVITSPVKHSPELEQAKATSGGVGYYSNALVNLSIGNSGKAAGSSSASPSSASAAPAGFGPVAAQAYNSYLASLGTSGLGITDPYIASLVSGHMGSSSAGGTQQSTGGYTTPSHGYGAAVDNLLGPGLGMGGYGSYSSTGYGGSYGGGVSSGLGGGAEQGAGSAAAMASAMLNSSSLTSPFGYSPAHTSTSAHAAPHASPTTSSSAAAAAASMGLASFTSPSAASYLSASASFPTLPSVQPQAGHQGRGMPSSSSVGSLHSAATSHAQLSHAVPSLYSAGALTALPSSHSTAGMGMGGMPSSSFEDSSVRAGITYLDDDLSASQRHAVAAAGSSPSRYGSAKYRQPSAYAASSPPRRQQQAAFTAQSPGFGYRQGGGDSQQAASPPRRARHRSSGSQSSGGRSGGRNGGRARARGARPPAGRASAAERREARLKKADRQSLVSNALTAASRRLR